MQRLASFCAGPIRTKIWDDLIRNAEPIADSGSLFAEHVQVAHALSVTETSKRSWFWEPEVIGKQVWKVSPQADLHTAAVRTQRPGWKKKRAPACHEGRSNRKNTDTLAKTVPYHGCQ